MPRHAPRHLPLPVAVARRLPGMPDPAQAILDGSVLVDGLPVTNPAARVRADAAITVRSPARLPRGRRKLEAALQTFRVPVSGRVAADLGASTGGFTLALLQAGAARLYAVDAGHGQLLGSLRAEPRVVDLEGTNVGALTRQLVPDELDLITVDLSYLAVARAVPQLRGLAIAPEADLVALVKPMFELGLPAPPADPRQARRALTVAEAGVRAAGWSVLATMESPIRGRRGAQEYLLHARRR